MDWIGRIHNILLNHGRQPRGSHDNIFSWEKFDQGAFQGEGGGGRGGGGGGGAGGNERKQNEKRMKGIEFF